MQKEIVMPENQTQYATVVGYFENKSDAGEAIQALREAGFTSAHLGVAHSDSSTFSSDSSSASISSTASSEATGTSTNEEKGTGVWSKVRNFFEGNVAEPYADERTQGDLANREVTTDPANANGYGHSDLHNSLTDLSVPEERTRYFGHRFGSNEQGAVVTVNAGDRKTEAEAILTRYGADLGENAASYDYSQAQGRDYSQTQGTNYSEVQGTHEPRNIQLLGEVLRVQKDRVNRGEIRLRKEIVTETQNVQVPVSREELVIERRAVDSNQPVTGNIGENREIRVPLSEDRASVDKSTVVREEVSIGKKSVQEVRDLSDQVRHEELVVEDPTVTTKR